MVDPAWAVLIGVGLVLTLMLWWRVHAFLALLIAALTVSLLANGPAAAVQPVLESFGSTVGKIGVVIALAAVIGQCLLLSGAADRIVGANVALLGERRAAMGLMAGGYVLAVPVFFDTVFYLLIPLARKLHLRTGLGYSLCLMALAGGAAATHALVPPTPGPLLVAATFGVSVGKAMGLGLAISIPACVVSYLVAKRLDLWTPTVMVPTEAESQTIRGMGTRLSPKPSDRRGAPERALSLSLSLLPIALPIVLIGGLEASKATGALEAGGAWASGLAFLGNPNVALGLATVVAMALLLYSGRLGERKLSAAVEESLLSAGVIILITAAGGAFGAALKDTGIAEVIAERFDLGALGPQLLLIGAFGLASLLKIAQGSSTVAMIVASGMLVAAVDLQSLTFDPVYLSLSVCTGSLVGSWMNDSGFWIFSKMGGLTERETLRTWTPLFGMVGVSGFAMVLILSVVWG